MEIGIFKEISGGELSGISLSRIRNKSVIYISVFSIVIYLILQTLLSLYPTQVFESPKTSEYVAIILIALPFNALMFFNSEIHRAKKRFTLFVVFQNFAIYLILCILFVIKFFFWDWTFLQLAYAFIAINIFLSILSFLGTGFNLEEKSNKRDLDFKKFWDISIPIGISTFCFFLMNWLDGVVLAQFYNEEIVGKYAIAFRVALIASFALVSINSAIGPRISQLSSENNTSQLIKEAKKSTKLGILVTFPFFIVAIFFPNFVLGFFGSEFKEVAGIMIILLCGQIINTILGPTGVVLQLSGHQKRFKNIVLISAFLSIILNYLLIPYYGIVGAAIVNLCSLLIWKIWSSILVKRIFGSYLIPSFSIRKIK